MVRTYQKTFLVLAAGVMASRGAGVSAQDFIVPPGPMSAIAIEEVAFQDDAPQAEAMPLPPAPPVAEQAAPEAASDAASADAMGIVRISDCPPGELYADTSSHSGFCVGCSVSPDHGWVQPGRVPINRVLVPYVRWYPHTWTGEPHPHPGAPRLPMIAVPTDTTQLGYTYQHVPAWRPAPGMIPPVPRPSDWHHTLYGSAVIAPTQVIINPSEVQLQPIPDMMPNQLPQSATSPLLLPTPR